MLSRDEIDALFAPDLPDPESWEARYPPRELPPGAMVTRFGPSPTGFAHLGGMYAAMLDKDLAAHSGGTYFVRIEDTDQARTLRARSRSSTSRSTISGLPRTKPTRPERTHRTCSRNGPTST